MPSRARQHCRGANLFLFFRESWDSVRQEGCELSLLNFCGNHYSADRFFMQAVFVKQYVK